METMPKWRAKHPCTSCQSGYGQCAQGLALNLKCCKDCNHPTRWSDILPYTKEDVIEMWKGRDMPDHVKKSIDVMQ